MRVQESEKRDRSFSNPQLRIWRPDENNAVDNRTAQQAESGSGLHPKLSLSAFFYAHVEPTYLVAGGARKRNIKQYRESVGMWKRYTGDPAIEMIDETTCLVWLQRMRTRKGRGGKPISANTLIKHRVGVQKVLDMAGPRSRANKDAATRRGLYGLDEDGVPREAPLIPRIQKEYSLPSGGWTLKEIGHWLECAKQWQRPRTLHGIDPDEFWPAIVTLLYNTGLRIGAALHVQRDMISRGWLTVPRELMKRRRDYRVWLNRHASEAVEILTTSNPRVIPWHAKSGNFYKTFREQFADVFPQERRAEISKPFHGLRARMLTILWAKAPGVAKMVADHKGDVTLDHYVGRSAMKKALEKLPQPPPRSPRRESDEVQRTFFD